MEGVRALAPVGADGEPHRQRRAVLAGLQRAEIVGDALRQHRHDAVGEVDRIAAFQRILVKARARAHIGCHIGNRHGEDMAPLVVRISIRRGVDSVVMILGVGGVYGDER